MKTTRRGTVLAATLLVLLLLCAAPALAAVPTKAIPLDGTPDVSALPVPHQLFENGIPSGPLAAGLAQHEGRDPDLVLALYDQSGIPEHAGPYQVAFWKEYVGTHSDVYVAWNDLAAVPESSYQDQEVTPQQVAQLGAEFDARIWASNVAHFGWYDFRAPDPALDGDRAAIMVYNIRDEGYWGDSPFYIAGYFWGGLNDEISLNAIFVDSYNWRDRIGPDAPRPYLYEGVIAHEFEHLIQNDVDHDEDSFIDEGMATLAAQFIYGPAVSSSDFAYALTYHRDSLTDWDGELYDYGNTVMWQDYLWERAGGGDLFAPLESRIKPGWDPFAEDPAKFVDPGDAFTWDLIHEQANGLEGIANVAGGMRTVEGMHRDWTLANLLDGKVSQPNWNYRNFVLGGPDSEGVIIEDGIKFYNNVVGGNMPLTRKNVYRNAATEPWGAYYRAYTGSAPGVTLSFSGPAQDGIAPVAGAYEWYSALGNMLDRTLERQVDGVTAGSSLTFMTWFDIEDQWDYGYVEASGDGGATWAKLEQVSTLPAASVDLNGSSAWDGAGGLTGVSAGWQQAEYSFGDLSGSVLVRFRYRTDEAVNGAGWYVDDVRAGSYLDDDTEAGWSTNGWLWTNGLQDNDWTADVFVPDAKKTRRSRQVVSLVGLDAEPAAGFYTGSTYVSSLYQKQFRLIAVMSNRPDGVFNSIGRLTIKKGR
jgi:hypothetical protein